MLTLRFRAFRGAGQNPCCVLSWKSLLNAQTFPGRFWVLCEGCGQAEGSQRAPREEGKPAAWFNTLTLPHGTSLVASVPDRAKHGCKGRNPATRCGSRGLSGEPEARLKARGERSCCTPVHTTTGSLGKTSLINFKASLEQVQVSQL